MPYSMGLRAFAFVLAALAATAAVGAAAGAGKSKPNGLVAILHDAQGNRLGNVQILPRRERVLVRARVAFLPPGFHGFHVHAVGRCDAPFTSAGGHFDLGVGGHGAHAGDMPVLLVNRDGRGFAEFVTDGFTAESLLDGDGSAVIVHAAPDNYANVPSRYASGAPDATTVATGDAGPRVACGVVSDRTR